MENINNTGSIGLAQINPIAGTIEYNAKKVVKLIIKAQKLGLDLVVFPELTLIGYPMKDVCKKFPIIAEESLKWLEQIAKITTKTTAIVGFINPSDFSNAVGILANGKIKKIVKTSQTIDVNNHKYHITIGQENLNKITTKDFDFILNCSSTPAVGKSEQLKHNLLSSIAQKFESNLIYINQVGAIDRINYAGCSKVFNKNGEVIAQAKSFEEQLLIANLQTNSGEIYQSAKGLELELADKFSLDYEPDLERTYKTVIQGIKDYFSKTGFKRAVLGLSGGLDSTVSAVLLADALGAENVFGISMPSKITSIESKTDAELLAKNLGIHFTQMPIKQMYDTTNTCFEEVFKTVESKWDGRYEKSFTPDNIQARSRAMILWGVSNEFASCLPIATSDKSEAYMGYATINGDMSGGFAPLADITKTKLFALARWLNKNREVKNAIPETIILKRPGAELAIDPNTGKPLCAEDALMPYEFLDEIIWRVENKQENYQQMLSSEFLYEKNHKISQDQKIQWLDKFYRRMSTAIYKWTIMPPIVFVDSKLSNYEQPITSSRINYKGSTLDEINAKILEFSKM